MDNNDWRFFHNSYGSGYAGCYCNKTHGNWRGNQKIDKCSEGKLLFQYPNIEWKNIMGLRDFIVHAYFICRCRSSFRYIAEQRPIIIVNYTANDSRLQISNLIVLGTLFPRISWCLILLLIRNWLLVSQYLQHTLVRLFFAEKFGAVVAVLFSVDNDVLWAGL